MAFLRLPMELHDMIVPLLIPGGFESYSLACKLTHEACEPYVREYKRVKKSYEIVDLMPWSWWHQIGAEARALSATNGAAMPMYTSLQLVQCIAHEPSIASYIRIADLGNDGGTPKGSEAHFQGLKAQMRRDDKVKALVTSSLYLAEAQQELSYWLEQILTESDLSLFSTTFLLTLLPNLEELTLPYDWGDMEVSRRYSTPFWGIYRCVWDVLTSIPRVANRTGEHGASLAKLRTLNPVAPDAYRAVAEFDLIIPFLSIGSVEIFYAGSCVRHDLPKLQGVIEGCPRFGNDLRSIELLGMAIDETPFFGLVKAASNLKSLKFTYSHKECYGSEVDAQGVFAAIGNHIGHSLTTLAVGQGDLPEKMITTLVSMEGFERLEHLELDTELIGPYCYDGPENPRRSYERWARDVTMPRLAHLVPGSLKTLTLITNAGFGRGKCLERLLEGIEGDIDTRLPALVEFTIHCGSMARTYRNQAGADIENDNIRASVEVIRQTLESVGGQLIDTDGEALPTWYGAFCDRIRESQSEWAMAEQESEGDSDDQSDQESDDEDDGHEDDTRTTDGR